MNTSIALSSRAASAVSLVFTLGSLGCGASEPGSGASNAMGSAENRNATPEMDSMSDMPRMPGMESLASVDPVHPEPPLAFTRGALPFALADLLKPRMEGVVDVDPYSAPLIYVEVDDAAGTNSAGAAAPLGRLEQDSSGALALDPTRPALYYDEQPLDLDGRELRQQRFLWFLPAAAGVRAQGLRVTFDSNQFPAVVEVLHAGPLAPASSAAAALFVSEALEARARDAFGAPSDGAASALLPQGSTLQITGQLAGGPVPMGPYAYQSRATVEILDLHCRCAPTRADAIRATIEYELLRLDSIASLWPAAVGTDVAAALADPRRALDRLRLPPSF